jgi:catalase (peroxidase I)
LSLLRFRAPIPRRIELVNPDPLASSRKDEIAETFPLAMNDEETLALVGGHTLVQSPGQQPDKCVVLSLQLQA